MIKPQHAVSVRDVYSLCKWEGTYTLFRIVLLSPQNRACYYINGFIVQPARNEHTLPIAHLFD